MVSSPSHFTFYHPSHLIQTFGDQSYSPTPINPNVKRGATSTIVNDLSLSHHWIKPDASISEQTHYPLRHRVCTRKLRIRLFASRKHLSIKCTPDLHLTYSKMGEIWGWYIPIKVVILHKIICYLGEVLLIATAYDILNN